MTKKADEIRLHQGRWRESGLVAAAIALLIAVTTFGYFTGTYSIGGDFTSGYNTEPFAWWRLGSFFQPPSWLPFMWGGYPAAASWQNSAFYLPVGIVASFVPFTIRVATVLHALHLVLGAVGVYVLLRCYKLNVLASLFALVAYYFGVAFFGNAQHTDIVRGFAWFPWVLLCTSPKWPWRRLWSVPVATLILWQTLIGSYPGITVMMVYGVLSWIILTRIPAASTKMTLRGLLPLAISGLAAGLLFLIKALPFFLVRGTAGAHADTASVDVGLGILSTLFFSHESAALAGVGEDPTMRSLFVIAPTLPLAMLARRSRLTLSALGLLAVATTIGLPLAPWGRITQLLPGIGLSRFQWADSRILIMLGIILIAADGLQQLTDKKHIKHLPWRLVAMALVPISAFGLARCLQFPAPDYRLPLLLLTLAAVITGVTAVVNRYFHSAQIANATRTRQLLNIAASALVLLGIISGVIWTRGIANTPWSWRTDRITLETDLWGTTSAELIENWPQTFTAMQRPARAPLPDSVEQFGFWGTRERNWNLVFFTGDQSIGGFVNLGTAAVEAIEQAVITSLNSDPTAAASARAFWAAPGMVFAMPNGATPAVTDIENCVVYAFCGSGLVVIPTGYQPGWWAYEVTVPEPALVGINEAYYPGFLITACPNRSNSPEQLNSDYCLNLDAHLGEIGNVMFELPAGAWALTITYRTPGMTVAWLAFGTGLAILLGWVVWQFPRRKQGEQVQEFSDGH